MKNSKGLSVFLLVVGIAVCVFSFQKYANYIRDTGSALSDQYIADQARDQVMHASDRESVNDGGRRQRFYDMQFAVYDKESSAKASKNQSAVAGFLGLALIAATAMRMARRRQMAMRSA